MRKVIDVILLRVLFILKSQEKVKMKLVGIIMHIIHKIANYKYIFLITIYTLFPVVKNSRRFRAAKVRASKVTQC